MKEITALQELIGWLNVRSQVSNLPASAAYKLAITKATELLTKDREQHYNSFVAGSERGTKDIPFNAEQYFDQNYKQP